MNYLNSSKSNGVITDIVLLLVRIFIGFAMLSHGFPKLQELLYGSDIQFFDFLGLGPKISLGLTVFAEFVCSIFIILGLFTRIALVFLVITMAVAGLIVHGKDPFDKREASLLYLSIYAIVLAVGPGKYSIDAMIEKKRESKW